VQPEGRFVVDFLRSSKPKQILGPIRNHPIALLCGHCFFALRPLPLCVNPSCFCTRTIQKIHHAEGAAQRKKVSPVRIY